MHTISLVAVVLTAGLTFAVASRSHVPEPQGHLILQVEGDAGALQVTRITPKPDPCGPARLHSEYAVVVRDAAGTELGRVPMDLSAFDLDPARIGQPLRVEGCVVKDTRVATLVSIPRWPTAAALDLVQGTRVLGTLAGDSFATMVRAGELR
jgi:hypothetical protein